MKRLAVITMLVGLGAFVAQAQTISTFTGADHAEFFEDANWSDGVPNKNNYIVGIITGGSIADLALDMGASVGVGSDKLTISNGTFNVLSTGKYATRNGHAPVQQVGAGVGNTGVVHVASGGDYRLLGGGADLVVGEIDGAVGIFDVDAGGVLNSVKGFSLNNGSFILGSTAQFNRVENSFVISDTGTLVFETDGTNSATIRVQPIITLGATATLDMKLSGSASVGDTWTIIRGHDGTLGAGVADLTFSGEFGTVKNSLNPTDSFIVHYGNGLAAASEVVVELAQPPVLTDFTNGSTDGTWANASNWSNGVPDTLTTASINNNLTADLSAGAGTTKHLLVGTQVSESGTVQNGSLTVEQDTSVGTASNAVGTVNVTSYTAGTVLNTITIGSGKASSGTLVSGSGVLASGSLNVGTGEDSSGTLNIGSGSIQVVANAVIGGGSGSSGSVSASSATLSGGVLNLGSGASSSGSLVASSGTIYPTTLAVASGSNSVGTLTVTSGTITNASSISIAAGQDSTGALTASTLVLEDGVDFRVATGKDSTATLAISNPIVLASTNGMFIGTGVGSSHNLTAADFSITGLIGNIGVGEGTGTEIEALINANNSFGALTVNDAFTFSGGTHDIMALTVNNTITVGGGTVTLLPSNTVSVASIQGANASLDLADWGTGEIAVGAVNVGRGDQAAGSLSYTAGTLAVTAGAGMEIGTGGDGSEATVLLKNLTGGQTLSICNGGTAPTGMVTVTENATVGTCRVGRGLDSVATLTVGGTLELRSLYMNAAGAQSNAVASITADSIIKTNNVGGAIQIAQGGNSDGRITADSGDVRMEDLSVAAGEGSTGLFALTNGTVTIQNSLSIALGDDSTGTVLAAFTSSATNEVAIGTGTNAVGSLILTGGTLAVSDLALGDAGTGGNGTITLAGSDLVVTGAVSVGSSSFIDITDNDSSFAWTGKTSVDFEGLWAAGSLSFNGESGLTGESFGDYFLVTGDVLAKTPIGSIAIANGMGGMEISWNSLDGTTYNVETNINLVIPNNWGVVDTVSGNGSVKTVIVPDSGPETFFRVIAQ